MSRFMCAYAECDDWPVSDERMFCPKHEPRGMGDGISCGQCRSTIKSVALAVGNERANIAAFLVQRLEANGHICGDDVGAIQRGEHLK